MSFYTLALFAHILGVLGLFIGIGLEWTSALHFRQAQFVSFCRCPTHRGVSPVT